jgi:proteasome lid subunit RPN8/RPN11
MDEAKANHPEANIVGWYHSHPNIGVFMSGTDMRTQQAFFYHDWSVSIVYDPVRQDIGFVNYSRLGDWFYYL